MAINLEEALLAKAQQDQQTQLSAGTAALLGSGAGALVGTAAGEVPYGLGKLKDRLTGGANQVTGAMNSMRNAVIPGPRFAGGLVGAILGGALGANVRSEAMQNNTAAMLLAKLQTEGTLSSAETQQLQNVLSDTYSNITGVA